MQVNKPNFDITRANAPARINETPSAAQDDAAGSSVPAPRSDAVQISDAGRALASSDTSDDSTTASLDSKRVDRLRANIFAGAYNSLEMADRVARSILRSGDL